MKHAVNAQPLTMASLRHNLILNSLQETSAALILKQGSLVMLSLHQEVYESEETIRYVYFPVDCIFSIVARMRDGLQIEIGTIGREGVSALPLLMGGTMSMNVCYCQVRGYAVRISADLFREVTSADAGFRQLLNRYLQAYVTMLGQLAACNRLHSVYERCSRWLLMTHDRVESDEIQLTHEFLAMMLGTNRSGVTDAAAALQTAGFIKYAHGTIDVLDRPGLEDAACECYEVSRDQFDTLWGRSWRERA